MGTPLFSFLAFIWPLVYMVRESFKLHAGVPVVAQWVKNLTDIHKDSGLIPGLAQWVKNMALLQAVGCGLDLALL